jgi:TolB protein
MNADGSDQRQLTNTSGEEDFPSWSPDAKEILYQSNSEGGGNYGIYLMRADGSNVRRLTDLAFNSITPVWGYEGQTIIFASDRDDYKWEIYAMDRDGGNLRRLTDNPHSVDRFPAWHP